MPELGYNVLILALITALYSATAYTLGKWKGRLALTASARNALYATAGLITISVGVLLYALMSHDFSLEYVADYTSRAMSLPYLVSSLWAGNDGSLLFWTWLLALSALAVVVKKRRSDSDLIPYAAAILMVVQVFFILLVLVVANPFVQSSTVPADGIGLNPLLENPGMIIHPPMLLAGYVLFSVPFALTISALVSRRFDGSILTVIRRWTLVAWLFLGVGNVIGAWWAYVELGWGGYWAWDPVENAGLMPWLIATAFIHSLMMQRRKGIFKVWNATLIILTFLLVIFGTFLTRSGILSSVHTFSDTGLGPFFLVFLLIIFFGSFGLLVARRKELGGEGEMESLVSREGTFLLTNLLFVISTFVIFLGTILPGLSEAVTGDKVAVGPSFFNQVNGPLFLAVILLIGVCSVIGWRLATGRGILRALFWPAVVSLAITALMFLFWAKNWYALAAFFICGTVVLAVFSRWLYEVRTARRAGGGNLVSTFGKLLTRNRTRYGGYIVHISMVVLAVGVIGSSFFESETEAIVKPGESIVLDHYTLTYEGRTEYETENKAFTATTLSLYNNGKYAGTLTPERYFQQNYQQVVTEVAIRSDVIEDLYVIPGGVFEDGSAAFQVKINPLVSWIWTGGVIFLVGGLLSFWPGRENRDSGGRENG